MAGLDPASHASRNATREVDCVSEPSDESEAIAGTLFAVHVYGMDGRVKPGHDE
jgi:hypothetical protein